MDRRQFHHVDLAVPFVPGIGRYPHRQTCLADPARSDKGDESMLGEVPDDAGEIGAATDERGHLGWQATRLTAGQRHRA